MLSQATAPLSSPLPLYAGCRKPRTRGVTPELAQAFADLNLLDEALKAG